MYKTDNRALRQRIVDILFDTGYPDYAIAVHGFECVNTLSDGIAGTDYANLYVNEQLSDTELGIVARHEILHVMLKHRKRQQSSFKPVLWNIAADYEVSNYYGYQDDLDIAASPLLSQGVSIAKTPEYCDMTAEEIYAALLAKIQQQAQDQQQNQQNQEQQGGSGQGSAGQGGSGGQRQQNQPPVPQEQGQNQQQQQPSEQGQPNQQGTEQPEQEQEQQGQGQQQEQDTEQEQQEQPEPEQPGQEQSGSQPKTEQELLDQLEEEYNPYLDLSPDEQEGLRNSMQQAIQQAYNSMSDEDKAQLEQSVLFEPGVSGKGGTSDISLETDPPEPEEVKLYYDLRRFFLKQQNVEKGKSYKRPNKKYQNSGIVIKARTNVYRESKTLAVYVDVSGSMDKRMVAKALGIVETMKEMKRTELIVKYFNTSLWDTFRSGGGGTNYDIIFQDAKKNNYTCVAIVTDDSWSHLRENYHLDALWIAGVEGGLRHDGSYCISNWVNPKDENYLSQAHITADHFAVSVVGHD